VSSLCRGHANLLCIVPIFSYASPKGAINVGQNWSRQLEILILYGPRVVFKLEGLHRTGVPFNVGPWPGLTRRQRVGATKTCLSFFRRPRLRTKSCVDKSTLAITHYASCADPISACRQHQPTPIRRSPSTGRRQYDDGGSDLFMNSQRTLTVIFQIFSESVHLHGVLGESKIASVLACQSSQPHASRVRLTVRHQGKSNHIWQKIRTKCPQLITGSYSCGTKKVNMIKFESPRPRSDWGKSTSPSTDTHTPPLTHSLYFSSDQRIFGGHCSLDRCPSTRPLGYCLLPSTYIRHSSARPVHQSHMNVQCTRSSTCGLFRLGRICHTSTDI
jgi:hypothetical protein